MSPYFQRNLVWREVHKKDFIETILLGLPFPQIFIAQGDIDVDTMTSQSCIVDGQQRMNSIMEFSENLLQVDGRFFKDMDDGEKEAFLRYQVPVIDLEIKASDPRIIDIFKRLNRTFYSLSAIEKMSTEYATVDLMLVAKFLCGVIDYNDEESAEDDPELRSHPFHPAEFDDWARSCDVSSFRELILKQDIFSPQELARVVHLMHVLNVLASVLCGFFARNDKAKELLQMNDVISGCRDELVMRVNRAARLILDLKLEGNFWWTKSNSFSLLVLFAWNIFRLEGYKLDALRHLLVEFSNDTPNKYSIATREGVNDRKQRVERHKELAAFLGLPLEESPILKLY